MKQFCYQIAFFTATIIAGFYQQAFAQSAANTRLKIASEMKASMVDKLLKPWYPRSIDTVYGGFISAFTYDFKPAASQDKMIVTQARHVWSTSKAAELFPETGYYKSGAKQGFEFLKNVLWDKTYGGFYTFTDKQGNPKKGSFAPKEAYGNSFALYALAAYYQESGDTSALNLAIKEFQWLEKHSHDPVYKGYFQHMERDGTPIKRTASTPSTAELGYKDQNTSIHLLESLTELYQVWPDPLVKERLQEMLLLVRDKITNQKGDLVLFFQPDWTPVSYRDSSEAVILKHRGLDHVSFGHDVETAYLMLEASHALGWKNDTATLKVGKKMLDHALAEGWDNKVGGFYDEGYYFKDKPGITIIADTKNWWAQAEGLNTLLLMADEYPNDPHRYFEQFKKLWDYVQTYLIDQEHGDWYQGGLDKQPEYKTALKGQIWKGTYHNFRALINCTERLNPDKTAPTVPQNLKLQVSSNQANLSWSKSTDNRILLGYNIYQNGQRIGFTPNASFIIQKLVKPAEKIAVKAIDFQGNESGFSQPVSYN
ncbi:AGE family epimerase/isomerase [Mucilaginibacter arboris]|uniref:N-acylglucosamine 2-epimerase n=1 Tax=Mucilaginibacter arboris TaxID=2682090 RepID=A0A7K1ST67_9SPHI|nr:AGE family epimerase/isomerase [Mucilaginibacter arboris]MVN20503.1 N-acylglucosamine 2-epimerase [Mucilaginibacter arboris]